MVKVRSLDLRGVPPRPQPVRPGDLGSEEDARRRQKEIEEEEKWIGGSRTRPPLGRPPTHRFAPGVGRGDGHRVPAGLPTLPAVGKALHRSRFSWTPSRQG